MLRYKTLRCVAQQTAGYAEDKHHFGCASMPLNESDSRQVSVEKSKQEVKVGEDQ